MNLRQLEYFIAVSDTLNFTKAAKQCFISQTAMTLQIKALEDTVGVPLFIRNKHHVELTAAGRVYLKEVREILAHAEEAIRLAQTAADGIFGSITIGFIRGYEQSDFYNTIKGFRKAYPNITIRLVRDNMHNLYEKLEKGEIDIAFNLTSYMKTYPELMHYSLKAHQMTAVVAADHPFASRNSITYSDLKNEGFIIMQPEGKPIEETEEVMLCYERGGFVPNITARENEEQTLLFMVAIGIGIAVLPEYSLRFYNGVKGLKMIPVFKADGKPETLDFEACWKNVNVNPSVNRLVDWIRKNDLKE